MTDKTNINQASSVESEERYPWLVTYRSVRSLLPMILWTGLVAFLVEKYCSNILIIPFPSGLKNIVGEGLSVIWLIPTVLGLETIRRYYNDRYIFSDDRLIHQTGRISFKYTVPVVNLAHVRVITVSQSLLGRLLNYGTIYVGTAGETGNEVEVIGIISPRKLAQRLEILRKDLERQGKMKPASSTFARASNQ
jgi:membrane protein YdbS with pleckstrin-like domain